MKTDEITIDWLKNKYKVKTDKELSDIIGYPVNTIRTWKDRGISEKIKLHILQNEMQNANNFGFSELINIRLLSHNVSAGTSSDITDIEVFDTEDVISVSTNLFKTPQNSNHLRATRVDGYSMIPMLMPESIVIFDTQNNRFKGDGLYVLLWRNVMMVKLLQLTNKGQLKIVSKNSDYESWEIDHDDQSVFKILGKVVKIII